MTTPGLGPHREEINQQCFNEPTVVSGQLDDTGSRLTIDVLMNQCWSQGTRVIQEVD